MLVKMKIEVILDSSMLEDYNAEHGTQWSFNTMTREQYEDLVKWGWSDGVDELIEDHADFLRQEWVRAEVDC